MKTWQEANRETVCKECAGEIRPGDLIFVARYRRIGPGGQVCIDRETYCGECGELYVDSQSMGKN